MITCRAVVADNLSHRSARRHTPFASCSRRSWWGIFVTTCNNSSRFAWSNVRTYLQKSSKHPKHFRKSASRTMGCAGGFVASMRAETSIAGACFDSSFFVCIPIFVGVLLFGTVCGSLAGALFALPFRKCAKQSRKRSAPNLSISGERVVTLRIAPLCCWTSGSTASHICCSRQETNACCSSERVSADACFWRGI